MSKCIRIFVSVALLGAIAWRMDWSNLADKFANLRIELDPLYVDTAIRRLQNLTGQDAVRVPDGKLFRDIEAEKEQADEY